MKSVYFVLLLGLVGCNQAGSDSLSPGTGVGGSMARFTIAADHLYIVNNSGLMAYSLSRPTDPQRTQQVSLNFGVETIFPYKNNLFIGTQTGMYIYGLANPSQPQRLSFYQHVQSCDPVVAQGNYAYVTLRSGTACRNTAINSLDIINISDLAQPKLIRSYPMLNPHGLGVDGSLLFVAEGTKGLKMLDVSDPLTAKTLAFFQDVNSFDVIPRNNTLIVTGSKGIYQYRYQQPTTSQPASISLLSQLPIQ
jgi:hypothetical protein